MLHGHVMCSIMLVACCCSSLLFQPKPAWTYRSGFTCQRPPLNCCAVCPRCCRQFNPCLTLLGIDKKEPSLKLQYKSTANADVLKPDTNTYDTLLSVRTAHLKHH